MQISEVDPRNLRASGRFGLPGASQGRPLIRLLDHFGASGGPWSFLQALWDLFATSWATLEAPLGRPLCLLGLILDDLGVARGRSLSLLGEILGHWGWTLTLWGEKAPPYLDIWTWAQSPLTS